jgi:ATP-dependent DNA ligase
MRAISCERNENGRLRWKKNRLARVGNPIRCGAMLVRPSDLPAGFIEPCLPSSAPTPPSGEVWLHEIKWEGFRVIARKDGARVKLYSRPGNDLTDRFPLIVEGMGKLRLHSCIIDGEAVACRADGMPCFELIRRWERNEGVFMWAFDLIELDVSFQEVVHSAQTGNADLAKPQ